MIVSLFWRSVKAIWRELDGLLTGLIIDGKKDDLSKVSGRSIDGNWMVCWRKLDGKLMKTGRSIDGKSEVYLRKQSVQQIFLVLGAWKFDFAEFRNQRFRVHLPFFNSFFPFWRLENTFFCRHETEGSKQPIILWENFTHFGIMKMISDDFWNQHFKVPSNEWKFS